MGPLKGDMTLHDLTNFKELRSKLFDAIKHVLERDSHCKGYEGTFEIIWPSYFFEDEEREWGPPDPWGIKLHCYVLGPARHYQWWGESFGVALGKATRDIERWIEEGVREEVDGE